MRADAESAKRVVEAYPRQVWLGYYSVSSYDTLEREPREPREPRRPREVQAVNWYATLQGDVQKGLSWAPEKVVADAANPRGWPLIPSEGNSHLHDRDESARARCENNLNDVLNPHAGRARSLSARANELDVTIRGIHELIAKIDAAAKQFK